MNSLMIGISGVRGIVGESLTPELLIRLGTAFGTYTKSGKIVIGRDTRVSGDMVLHAVVAGLMSTGCSIIDIGVVTTPTVALMIEELEADGGIVISASHNPIEWNALKFMRSDGIFLNDRQGRQLLDIYYQGEFNKAQWNELKELEYNEDANKIHIEKTLEIVDQELIKSKKFRVAIDCCNGAGAIITPTFLTDYLGCEVVPLHCTPDGMFPHNPEPSFGNLQELCGVCAKENVDVGFAQDPDADRFAIISGSGAYIGEELSLVLATAYRLQKEKGTVVSNLSTTRALEDVAKSYGCELVRTPVGEVNVAEKMKKIKSVIGGEGNGGVIDPKVHYGRDSLVGIALTLQYMAETEKSIDELVLDIPKYIMIKEKIACPKNLSFGVLDKIEDEFKSEKVNMEDGLRIDWEDSWVHLRASNTEPIIRVIAEATTKEQTKAIIDKFKNKVVKHIEAIQ